MRRKSPFIVFFTYLLSICIGLLFLILVEGLFTYGQAFNFENYSFIGWVTQVCAVLVVLSASILITNKELK